MVLSLIARDARVPVNVSPSVAMPPRSSTFDRRVTPTTTRAGTPAVRKPAPPVAKPAEMPASGSSCTRMSDQIAEIIFGTIFKGFAAGFPSIECRNLAGPHVKATTAIAILVDLRPTPAKSHYTYYLRSNVFQSLLMAVARRVGASSAALTRLRLHECDCVFADRGFGGRRRGAVADFMIPGTDPRVYKEVRTYAAADSRPGLGAIAQLTRSATRCCWASAAPRTRLATFMPDYKLCQIKITESYSKAEWHEDLRRCLLRASTDNHSDFRCLSHRCNVHDRRELQPRAAAQDGTAGSGGVWDMADSDRDARLSRTEFAVAMHLIVCISKKGLPPRAPGPPPAVPRRRRRCAPPTPSPLSVTAPLSATRQGGGGGAGAPSVTALNCDDCAAPPCAAALCQVPPLARTQRGSPSPTMLNPQCSTRAARTLKTLTLAVSRAAAGAHAAAATTTRASANNAAAPFITMLNPQSSIRDQQQRAPAPTALAATLDGAAAELAANQLQRLRAQRQSEERAVADLHAAITAADARRQCLLSDVVVERAML
ncbi:hypothetical protein JKP88DRAFT_282178 [Tribonema minus]|uniref:EF-hand domain-containing protein n=1 Tax=Tribonema minus TaxID=303371 RepID=A0A836C918_9STRA|nr:hypothetical protein JKP88DRAFT_282178 [Tribonema minus]